MHIMATGARPRKGFFDEQQPHGKSPGFGGNHSVAFSHFREMCIQAHGRGDQPKDARLEPGQLFHRRKDPVPWESDRHAMNQPSLPGVHFALAELPPERKYVKALSEGVITVTPPSTHETGLANLADEGPVGKPLNSAR